jgi:hypothetical protein
LLFHSVLASLVRDSCRHVVYVARSSLSLGWALLRASARPGRAKPGHSPLSTASRGCFSYCRQFAKTGCAAALPQQEKNNSEDLQRDRAYITGFILAVESQPSPRCTFNGFESLAVASRRRNRKFEPLLLRLRLRTLTLTLNPPCSVAAFVVNSEPHNGARPSLRLCVGLMAFIPPFPVLVMVDYQLQSF